MTFKDQKNPKLTTDNLIDHIDTKKIEFFYIEPNYIQSDLGELDLRQIWFAVWSNRWLFVAIVTISFAISVSVALYIPNVYKADALLSPAEELSGGGLSGGGLGGGLGGLASLAGLQLGGANNKSIIALEIMQSKQFLIDYIDAKNIKVALMAAKGWDPTRNQLIIDDKIYDINKKAWVRDVSPPKQKEPSSLEAYKRLTELMSVTVDSQTGLIRVSLMNYSPELARDWLRDLIDETNQFLRHQDIVEANKNISFLQSQFENTSVAQMKTVFSQLIEEQTKVMMLAQGRIEYAFKIIDSPMAPEEKEKPNRFVIVFVGFFLGVILGIIVTVLKYVRKR